ETILDVIAPGYKVVGPSTNRSGSSIQTPTLSSVEGYVLSCIQSPVAIWEAASFTGLSHTETRSALLVFVLLGLLVDQQCPPPDMAGAQNVAASQASSAEDDGLAAQIETQSDAESLAQADQTVATTIEATSTSREPERLLAADDPGESIQWCPVEYTGW